MLSPFSFYDVEMYSACEKDSHVLFTELAVEDGTEDELPPILQDEVPGEDWDTWGEAA